MMTSAHSDSRGAMLTSGVLSLNQCEYCATICSTAPATASENDRLCSLPELLPMEW